MSQLREPSPDCVEILEVAIHAVKPRIQYGYYRMMKRHHQDRNSGVPRAVRLAALINEAKDLLLGRMMNSYLIKDAELVYEVMDQPVSEEDMLSYEEWIRKPVLPHGPMLAPYGPAVLTQ